MKCKFLWRDVEEGLSGLEHGFGVAVGTGKQALVVKLSSGNFGFIKLAALLTITFIELFLCLRCHYRPEVRHHSKSGVHQVVIACATNHFTVTRCSNHQTRGEELPICGRFEYRPCN